MSADTVWLVVIFLSLFQVLGGMRVGAGIQDLRAHAMGGIGRIIGGSLFGGAPIVIEVGTFFSGHPNPLFLLIGPTVFAVTILVRVLLWDDLVEQFGFQPVLNLGMGVFLIVVAAIAIPLWQEKSTWVAGVLFSGTLTIIGSGSIINGARAVIGGRKTEDARVASEPKKRKQGA